MNSLLRILVCVGGSVFAFACPFRAAAADKPNVLLIVVDDLGCRLGCYGEKQVQSPNIDRLAARGMRFDRAYCQYTLCNPSRSSFLSSWRPDKTGIYENVTSLRKKFPDVVLLPQLFRQNGYQTTSLGKVLHIGLAADGKPTAYEDVKSWDLCRSFSGTPLAKRGEGRNLTAGLLPWCSWLATEGDDEDHADGKMATFAAHMIQEKHERPQFLAVGIIRPHTPLNAPKKYFAQYPLDKIELPEVPQDRTPDLAAAMNLKTPFSRFTDRDRRECKQAYYACVSFTDAQVGKMLDALDRGKLWDNTIVVLMGDHGFHLGEHLWWNKITLFEHCARAPLIVWAPGCRGMGRSTSGIVEFVDIYPTLAELCGLTPPPGQAGKSFKALLEDPSLPGKPAAVTQIIRDKVMGRSVRTARWRYTEWDDGRAGVELYDHSEDPEEYHNRATDPQLKSVVADLRNQLHKSNK